MVVNKFRMKSNIMSFNLSSMGCRAAVLSVSLAMRVHHNSLDLISTPGQKELQVWATMHQLLNIISIFVKKVRILRWKGFYMPNFKRACEHFCIHAGGRTVIQAIKKPTVEQRGYRSFQYDYRFGNTSSSSVTLKPKDG
ncbi:probable 3-ketoacyl-CoA synthase 21 [Tripterygium wilfordii]|uniref:probable 3-ketoacyl-CoA synthase 21 n=1 Tax=Tripterygium wilfordii TaxID=458696 RepID=UPI0018F80194|nr:probable 3-ketoacyl-CoA synthase 21 [Tripterygium wilfordii]